MPPRPPRPPMTRAWRTSSYKENNGSPLSRISSTHTCKQYSTGGEHTCNNEASEQAVPPRLAMLRAWRASSYIENDGSPAKTSPEANITSEHGINKGMRREFQQKGSFFISESHSYRETVHGSPPKTTAEENIASEKELHTKGADRHTKASSRISHSTPRRTGSARRS